MSDTDDSCELTPEEEKLLAEHLIFYRDLETGRHRPQTKAQEHFVLFTLGRAAAETIHERAYAKHMRLRGKLRAANEIEIPRDPREGPSAEWFLRADWYRFRGNPHDE